MTAATLIELPIEDRITNAVAIFRKQDVAIAAMKAECLSLKIAGVEDKEGYTKVYESRQTAKRLRVAVGKKAKSMKEDALRDGKMLAAAIDSEEKRITLDLHEIEEHLQEQEDEYEAAKAKIKADKESAAQVALQKRIDRLTSERCPLPDVAFLRDIDADNFELYFAKAVEVQVEKERIEKIEADRIAAEQAAAKAEADRIESARLAEIARQAEELKVRQAELAAERKAMEAEREAALHQQAIQQKQIEEQQAEVRRQQDELRKAEVRKQIEENHRLAEIAKAEDEAAEAARLESLKPEIEKVRKLHDAVNLCVRSYLDRIGKPSWSDAALREINAACNQIILIVSGQ